MKRDIIALYGGDPATYPRMQDFVDVGTLESLSSDQAETKDATIGVRKRISEILGRNQ